MILPIDCLDMFLALLPESGSWLAAVAEPGLRIDEGVAAGLADVQQDKHAAPVMASARFAATALLLFAMAVLVWWRWRPVMSLPGRRQLHVESSVDHQVIALRRRHGKRRNPAADQRMDALMELHRLYTRGDTAAAYEGLKRHFETHPFELNLYIVSLNMLAESGCKPSPEMLHLLRHGFRQLKMLRPHMWLAVAEYGQRVVPHFERWDDKPPMPPRNRPLF